MKYTFICLALLISLVCKASNGDNFEESNLFETMQQGDKAALLIVHFGTTHDLTRKRTIEVINNKMKSAFPDVTIREAYTSRIVINRLKQKNIIKQTPSDVLFSLKEEGYTHIIVQSSNIIEGIEMEALRHEIENMEPQFKDIRIGNPLLYTVEDYEKVVDVLSAEYKGNNSTLFVGHGTYTPATACYAMLDYMLKDKGFSQMHIGTIEGYPSFETVLRRLKSDQNNQVTLVPFMFVAGDHAVNDIDTEWKSALEKEGFRVNTNLRGLGEIPMIQDQFIEHARFACNYKMVKILDKKKRYANEGN